MIDQHSLSDFLPNNSPIRFRTSKSSCTSNLSSNFNKYSRLARKKTKKKNYQSRQKNDETSIIGLHYLALKRENLKRHENSLVVGDVAVDVSFLVCVYDNEWQLYS